MALTFADTTKSDASEGFDQIIDFLNASSIKYALTVNPNIYVSCIKQFWTSVSVKKVNGVTRLQALVDKKKVIITKATIRDALRLDDAESIDCLPNEEIFIELSRMGVDTPLSEGMIVAHQDDGVADEGAASVAVDDVPAAVDEPSIPSPTPTTQPPPPSQDLPSTLQVKENPKKDKIRSKPDKNGRQNSLIDQETSESLEDLEIIQEEDTHPSLDTSLNHEKEDLEIDEPQSDIVPIRRSTRTRHAPYRMCLYIDVEEHELGDLGEPANYKAALLDPESEKWLNAMNVEMQSMKDNEVWVLVELPPNGKTVGSKWLFKKKTDMDENVHIYKARLVAKEFTQTSRIDYEETFSSVADIRAIRILIAIAAYYDYEIWQMDVKTAFLNGYLNEEEKLKLSKSQGASTPAEMKRMQNVPYALANSGDIHWTTVKNILKYLKNTKDMFLVYGEAKYIAAFDASKEAVWVRKFISGLSVVPTIEEPISMYCDNTGAIVIAYESGITKGARHFRAKVHYLREVIEFGDIKLEKVKENPKKDQIGSKPDKNEKRGEAEKIQKQLQWIEGEILKKTEKEGPEMQTHSKL
nr:putative retrotransposon Ty1-copia subclass protein [Tanacetum cinerariifolium]